MSLPQRPYVARPKTLCLCPIHRGTLHFTAPILPFSTHHIPLSQSTNPHYPLHRSRPSHSIPYSVGYQTISVTPGVQTIKGAQFVTVGDDEMDIQDIKMNENLIDYQAQIWWWNGSTYDAKAYWFTELYADEEGAVGLGYAGWGDFDYWMPISKTFAPGESFWIKVNDTADAKDATYTMAGQVESVAEAEEYYTIPLTPGVQVQLSNPFPTGSLDIQSIKMNENIIAYQAQIWWWNGSTYDAKAYWFTELYADEEGVVGLGYAGWGDFDYWMPISKSFGQDEGFWIKVNDTATEKDAEVKFPNPFYKEPVK